MNSKNSRGNINMEVEHREYRKVTVLKVTEPKKMIVYHESLSNSSDEVDIKEPEAVKKDLEAVKKEPEVKTDNDLGEFNSEEELLRDALDRAAEQEKDLHDVSGVNKSGLVKTFFVLVLVLVLYLLLSLTYGGKHSNNLGEAGEINSSTYGKVKSVQVIDE